ncbi:MAG: hypothetical protein R3E36_08375 [Nitrosomonas sp.]|nr:hypothetical protein [Nitrosomonas sp.]
MNYFFLDLRPPLPVAFFPACVLARELSESDSDISDDCAESGAAVRVAADSTSD